ncbi:general secretion pathway protein GspB [Vibrio fluminensis]|uniref:general secretion pathway protein GspB n=1 Tax=Vibrio fluminensis TaxID=2783614 RepID=UPI001888C4E0|nr:general secretion pathway protein GspB [Vibrio fluminensis]
MANLIQSLEESQQGYQAHHSRHASFQPTQQIKAGGGWGKCAALVVLPVMTASLVVSGMTYIEMRNNWLAENVGGVEVVEFSQPIQALSYPDVGVLRDTQRELVAPVTRIPASVASTAAIQPEAALINASSSAETGPAVASDEQDDLLEGIDFSTLSPDVAQLLQSAMESESSASTSDDVFAQSLLTNDANLWAGRLPALNFQTHVYSSNPNKRWVKVNNTEFQEGSWLADGVKLVSIEPQACVIEFDNQRIQVPALYDWQG